jgi:threonine dehydratase
MLCVYFRCRTRCQDYLSEKPVAADKPVNGFKEATIADSLAVPVVGPTAFKVARHFVDSSCEVSEKQIALAMLRLIEMEKVIVESGGAAALAAILPTGPLFGQFRGKKVTVVLGGGNMTRASWAASSTVVCRRTAA